MAVELDSPGTGLVLAGVDPDTGAPAVMGIDLISGQRSVLFQGSPLVNPDGVVVATDGTVYVTDGEANGSAFAVSGGEIEEIVSGAVLGSPPGVSLTTDDSTLLISALDGEGGHSQVIGVNLSTGEPFFFNDVIGENTSSGGLHRARNLDLFVWADTTGSNGGGSVYRVRPGGS